ncbi:MULTISPECIES: hypothetical protein [unclassified Rhizobium]|uniref:hypothetical protein n=1 Tax=unclassified Rhizobium TaxID=2613769 RepID=UPI00146F360D|nr:MULTISPECIES: hypothetical protein [unclassified Rhizobium]MBD9445743.1 hypothetical protein [Rhizobium sp. RHZ01]NMN73842.1 hypothetical protein [Rhizobium sp. 57MFTsu3.2]
MFRTLPLAAAIIFATTFQSQAGLQSWSVEKESDPFSGGESVSVNFMTTFRSGVLVLCDSAKKGLRVRAIPGFDYDQRLADFKPTMKFAFDGKLLFTAEGETGSVGNNLAASEVELEGDQAKLFVEAFASAKKQIAIDDGIADKPHLLTAKGSTTSGSAIVSCIEKQGTSS